MCAVFTLEMMKDCWKDADTLYEKKIAEDNARMDKLVSLSGISPDDLIEMDPRQIEKLLKKFDI